MTQLQQAVERIARQARDAGANREQSQQVRDLARKMIENSTPEQREQLRRMAEHMARERPELFGGGAGEGPRHTPNTEAARAPSAIAQPA